MDTSETRIKMCEKAEEIQKLAPDAEDSKEWFCCPICHALTLDGYYTGCSHDVDDKLIWLPRQDQFQEILGVKLPANALFAISGWITKMN